MSSNNETKSDEELSPVTHQSTSSSDGNNNAYVFDVYIIKGEFGLGLEIANTADGGTVIEKLKDMSPNSNPAAACDPPIESGDTIIAVNDQASNVFATTVAYIRAAQGTVKLTLRREINGMMDDVSEPPTPKERTPMVRKISKTSSFLRNPNNVYRAAGSFVHNQMERNNIGNLGASRFKRWKQEELIDLLISQNVELRGEEFIPISTLRGLCDNLYPEDVPMPNKIPELTDDEYERYNKAARVIQNCWIAVEALRRLQASAAEEEASSKYIAEMGYIDDNIDQNVYEAEAAVRNDMEESTPTAASVVSTSGATPGDVELGQVSNADSTTGLLPSVDATKEERKSSVWVPPTKERAEEYLNYRHPRKYIGYPDKYDMNTTTGRHCCVGGFGEQCDLFAEGQVSEFAQFGPGITNYFKFLKWNMWLFLVLSCISLPILVFNYYGPAEDQDGVSKLSMTTAANVMSFTNSTEDIPIPGCGGYDYNGISCSITPTELASMYCWLDVGGIMVVLIAYVWLRIFERKEGVILNKNTVTVSEFSVKVSNLPKVCTPQELKAHLAKVTRHAVANVVFAYNNSDEIKAYRKRGLLIKERVRVMQEEKYYEYQKVEKKQYIMDEAKIFKKLRDKKMEIGRKIQKLEAGIIPPEDADIPLCAFVTFEERIGAIACKALYTYSLWDYYNMPIQKRFKNARLIVEGATEPSTILWENLNFSSWDRRKRRLRTAIVAFALIFVSLAARLTSTVVERSAQNFAGDSLCPANWDSLSEAQKQSQVEANDEILHCYCDELTYDTRESDPLCHEYFVQQVKANVITYLASFTVVVINMVLDWAVEKFAGYEKHTSIDKKGLSVFKRLFWLYVVNTAVVFVMEINASRFGFVTAITGLSPSPKILNFSADWYRMIGVAIILVQLGMPASNQGYYFFTYLAHKAKINRANNSKMAALTQDELNNIYIGPVFKLANRYAINTSIFFVCFIFSLGIPLLNFIAAVNFYIGYLVDKFLFVNFYRSPVRYDTSICEASTRLIPVAVVAHIVCSIWTLSNEEIFASTSSENIVTNQGGQTASSAHNSIVQHMWDASTKNQTIPLFALLVFVVLCLLVEYFIEAFYGSVGQVLVSLFGNVCSKWSYLSEMKKFYENHRLRQNMITYSRAVQRGIIKGLHTYNILQNPLYQENFAISNQFALEHSTLKSMKFTKSAPPPKKKIDVTKFKQQKVEKKPAPKKKKESTSVERVSSDVQREMLMAREMEDDSSRSMNIQ